MNMGVNSVRGAGKRECRKRQTGRAKQHTVNARRPAKRGVQSGSANGHRYSAGYDVTAVEQRRHESLCERKGGPSEEGARWCIQRDEEQVVGE